MSDWSWPPMKRAPGVSYVYFIGCHVGDAIHIKIGYTARTPHERLNDFQPGSPCELDLLAYIQAPMRLEKELHYIFDEYRLHNEWFLATGRLGVVVSHLMMHGKGARWETPYRTFLEAMQDEMGMVQ